MAIHVTTALAEHVTDLAESTFAVVSELRTATSLSDLSGLRPRVIAAVSGLISGAGVITTGNELEWWMGPGPTRLELDLDPTSDTYVDVQRQQWFTIPRETGRRHVTGPYVDYVCAEQYALTFTEPIHDDDGAFAGIAGADVFVADFERALRPALRTVGSPTALVNTHGRVVAGTTAQHLAGSLIRDAQIRDALIRQTPMTLPGGVSLTPCGTLPLTVLTWP
ncbi:cache domain-containing protein [Actinoplanes derwentensis]|uniref:Cache domain-containing protein n=1 Tax=Actinoplanes derwentensis TaxID=113562 RepID=A0A1H1REU0_9ACTN|nr:cache domain-containing protein [Actinoplanes derwentensis]GID89421.1 hypothetical protein Ade03nite_83450 [Actinoplanes derwentensis]SDS34218.1 hypothetical protein SAMN04489716_0571 [Actinoplanes derwentensis]